MALTVVLGGARSGKSAMAVRAANAQSRPVVFIATGQAGDEEMTARIAVHRAQRPPAWETVEEPLDLEGALWRCPPAAFVIVDCLTLWVANLVAAGADVRAAAGPAAAAAAGRPGPTVVVSNEVGSGIVPASPATRHYRDLLGEANATFVAAAGRAWLMVAGRAVALAPAEGLFDG